MHPVPKNLCALLFTAHSEMLVREFVFLPFKVNSRNSLESKLNALLRHGQAETSRTAASSLESIRACKDALCVCARVAASCFPPKASGRHVCFLRSETLHD